MIGWERDLCQRIAARYGLDFWIADSDYASLTTQDSGYQHPGETREATSPELDMWRMLVPPDERELITQVDRYQERTRPFLVATPDEVFCAASFTSEEHLYMASEDFAVLWTLEGFEPCADSECRQHEQVGTFKGCYRDTVYIYVNPFVPHGYYVTGSQPVKELHGQADGLDEATLWIKLYPRLLRADRSTMQRFQCHPKRRTP